MHPNPAFRRAPPESNFAFALTRGFGALCVNGSEGPLLSHIPFCGEGRDVEFHLVRNAPMARALQTPQPGLLAVSGADAYVSPDWYGMAHQVPTWNYIAVHLRGVVERLPDASLRAHLERLSAAFEERLEKAPWRLNKVPEQSLAAMMQAIVPCVLHVEEVQGTCKLSQNKPKDARIAAGRAMAAAGFGAGADEIGARMQEPD